MTPRSLPLARQRRAALLIVGCGDIGTRVLQVLAQRWRVIALTTSAQRVPELRALGAVPLRGDLDQPHTLGRLGALASAVVHLAPPPNHGSEDPRTAALCRALARAGSVRRLVYISTSGVYGDCGGAWVDETQAPAPATPRAVRRVAAEARVRHLGRQTLGRCRVTVLRAPGIYAYDREGRDPRERLRRGTPALRPSDDVYTNHIHADDLARACVAALFRGRPQRVINACDRSAMRMGDYFDLAADLNGLTRPPRISREQAAATMSPMQMSFMSESRRLRNARLENELRLVLRHPTVEEGLRAAPPGARPAR